LRQDFGLGHYEGHGWRGFHDHTSLSIAAYGFLMPERPPTNQSAAKNVIERQMPALPKDYIPRGSPARAGRVNHSITTLRLNLSYALVARLGQCPCRGRANTKLLL
jgi:hypothetical protein